MAVASNIKFVRPPLYPKQLAAIYDPARFSVIEASTKSGKTSGCIVWLSEKAFTGKPRWNYWWAAPVGSQADIAFHRMRHALGHEVASTNLSLRTLTLFNGPVIWFKSGDRPDSLYGEDVYGAVVDEASRFKEDAWTAIRTTLTATQAPARLIGNVKGRKNWFYRLARAAEKSDDPELSYHRLTAFDAVDAGVFPASEIESARRSMPAHVFKELFMAEASDDSTNPFGLSAIDSCVSPLSSSAPVVWGWDLAKSVDWTVGIALDAAGRVCRFLRFQKPWNDTTATIRRETGNLPAFVDSTGVGDPVTEMLQRQLGHQVEGYKFTSQSKQQLMEGLAVAIQEKRVRYPEGPIAIELRQFEYEYTQRGVRYSASEGAHDDCVCALALAVSRMAPYNMLPYAQTGVFASSR